MNHLFSPLLRNRLARRTAVQTCRRRGMSNNMKRTVVYMTEESSSGSSSAAAAVVAMTTAAAAVVMYGTTTLNSSVISCEEEETELVAEEEKEKKKEDDPYETLPEEDEPTGCMLCKVNRQGPCRIYWRRFEQCTKDNFKKEEENKEGDNKEEEENSDTGQKCDVYMLPWLECIQSHLNLYRMISNQVSQYETLDDYETDMYFSSECNEPNQWKIDINNDIDWTNLWNYSNFTDIHQYHPDASAAKEFKEDRVSFFLQLATDLDYYEERKQNNNTATKKEDVIYDAATYQGDPPLVNLGIRVPLFLEENDGDNESAMMPLVMCYVRDQNGRMLGMDQFYSAFSPKEDEPPLSSQSEEVLKFCIEPGKTTSLRFYKIYKSPPPKQQSDDENEEKNSTADETEERETTIIPAAHTFVSEPIHIIQAAYHYQKEQQQQESLS